MDNNNNNVSKHTKISPKETVSVTPTDQVNPVQQKPLIPTPDDLPKEAEPAMEERAPDNEELSKQDNENDDTKSEDAEEDTEEAGESSLADEIAPKQPEKKAAGVDDALEELRLDRQRIDEAPEDTAIDLDTNQIIVGAKNVAELEALILKQYKSKELYDAAKKDPNSLLSRTIAAARHGWGTTSGPDITEVLSVDKTYEKLTCQRNDDKFPGIGDGHPRRVNHQSVDVTGQEAILALKSRKGGIVRVSLLNSGFWVALRSPELDELQEIFASIDFENKEIGRIIGGHFALITDMYLKRKFIDMLVTKRIIIESNFKDVFKAGAFARNVAYHDYDTLIHAVVALMTRGGLRYRCICPSCGNVSIETLDVSSCKLINEDLWTPEVEKYWNTTRDADNKVIRRTEKDLIEYRTNILNRKMSYTQMIDNGLGEKVRFDIVLTEPTMLKYFDIGNSLISTLTETINNISNAEQDKSDLVKSTLAIHSYQLIAPWVESINVYDDAGNVEIRTSDPKAIINHLDDSIQKDDKLFETLIKFIAGSRFNYIGSCAIECPSCHAKPSTDMKNFVPLEVQTIFFGLLSRLWLSGR